MPPTVLDTDLKARHRAMWASGDYPGMVESWLLPIGSRLVTACDITPGMRVLDVAAGTGNASLPAAARGAEVVAGDLTPELLEAGARRAADAGLELEWVEADARRSTRSATSGTAAPPGAARFAKEYLLAVGTRD